MYQLNNSLFETDPVLALECSIKDFEISMREAEYMLEMVDYRNQLNCQRAELKVMMEHGGYEDLGYLYEAADEDKKKSEGGILSAIWNKIKGFFSDIGKAFKNLVSKAEPDKKYPFPQGFEDAMNAAVDAAGKTKSAIVSVAGNIGPGLWGIIAGAIAAISLAVKKWGNIVWDKITDMIPGKKLQKTEEELNKAASEINTEETPSEDTKKKMEGVQDPEGKEKDKNLFQKFQEMVKDFPSKVGKIFTDCAKTIRDVLSGKKAQKTEDTPKPEDKPKDEPKKTDDEPEKEEKPKDSSDVIDEEKPNATSHMEEKVQEAFTEATENLANLFALIDAL